MFKSRLLSTSMKTEKSDNAGLGYLTKILYLAPHKLSGFNVCPHASNGCISACLNKSGNGLYPHVQRSRIAKTTFFFSDRPAFMKQLIYELYIFERFCLVKKLKPAVRLNGTSDIQWEKISPEIFIYFSNIQFYDYTKNLKRMLEFCKGNFPKNYHLTFSRSESNSEDVEKVLKNNGSVAVVFYLHTNDLMPKSYLDYKVQNGDLHDLRFLDKPGIIGLKAKGVGRSDQSGFVVRAKE